MAGEMKVGDRVLYEGREFFVGKVVLLPPDGHVTLNDSAHGRGGGIYTTIPKALRYWVAQQEAERRAVKTEPSS